MPHRIPALLLLAAALTACTDPTVSSPAIAKGKPPAAQPPGGQPAPSISSAPPLLPGAKTGATAEEGDAKTQRQLAFSYLEGKAGRRDLAKALELFRLAAGQGDAEAQYQLARMYHLGLGVERDEVLAGAWAAIAANKGVKAAAGLAGKTPDTALPPSVAAAPPTSAGRTESAPLLASQILPTPVVPVTVEALTGGAALLVSADGRAVTSRQMVQDCRELRLEGLDGQVRIVAEDAIRDLALLEIAGQFAATAPVTPAQDRELDGEELAVLVLPPPGMAGSRDGVMVSAAARSTQGLSNNSNQIELSVALEPSAGGSPVIDANGNLVGLVSPRLDHRKMADKADSNPASVNFAIGGQALRTFLDSHRVAYRRGGESSIFSRPKSLATIAQDARKWTLGLECRR